LTRPVVDKVLEHIRPLASAQQLGTLTDREPLGRFVAGGDEAAFAGLPDAAAGR
jgi:hypothetical protein